MFANSMHSKKGPYEIHDNLLSIFYKLRNLTIHTLDAFAKIYFQNRASNINITELMTRSSHDFLVSCSNRCLTPAFKIHY